MFSVNLLDRGAMKFLNLETGLGLLPQEDAEPICALHEPVMVSKNTRPLRVIDVLATLGYAKEACNAGTEHVCTPRGVSFVAHPSDWNFHVISHTWSRAIRNLSDTIGSSLPQNSPSDVQDVHYDQGHLYNHAFQTVDFSSDEGYQHLIDFLMLLMVEGVRRVWFDALCINQTDKVEKEREITHMGSYYKHSMGCYVVTHGFGRGFTLLKDGDDAGDHNGHDHQDIFLPRWFSRVWTLQEFLLPTQLAFVVDLSDNKHVISHLNVYINQFSPSKFFCNCCLDALSAIAPFRHLDEVICRCCELPAWECPHRTFALASKVSGGVGNASCFTSQKCTGCGSYPLIRGVGSPHCQVFHSKHSHHAHLYFVERDAYPALLLLHRFCSSHALGITQVRNFHGDGRLIPHIRVPRFTWECMMLYILLKRKCFVCNAWGLAYLIRCRDCSEEEDRLLSILCLMGLEGNMQVRTGKSLGEQWINVAETLVKVQPSLLLQFCIQDMKGAWCEGASWIPNYHKNGFGCKLEQARSSSFPMSRCDVEVKGFHHNMGNKSVGALKIQGKVVGSRLVPLKWHSQRVQCTCASCQHLNCNLRGSTLHQKQRCCLQVKDALSIPLSAHILLGITETADSVCFESHGCYIRMDPPGHDKCYDCEDAHNGGMCLPLICMHELLPLEVSLVLWGSSLNCVNDSFEPSFVIMVCIGRAGTSPGHLLHKIGVLNLAPELVNAIFDDETPRVEFVLGGFGRKVRDLWKVLGAVNGIERVNCLLHKVAQTVSSIYPDKVPNNTLQALAAD